MTLYHGSNSRIEADRGLLMHDALDMVYNSATYEKLINRAAALYRESPAYIYELLKQELAENR